MSDRPFRLLITGPRTWKDRATIHEVLADRLRDHPDAVLVSGHCPDGADLLCEQEWARLCGYTTVDAAIDAGRIEPHSADWDAPCRPECRPGHRRVRYGRTYCPAAGNYRNQAMVDAGVDACDAFLAPCTRSGCRTPGQHDSHGTDDCRRRVERAGIQVMPHRTEKASIPVRRYTSDINEQMENR